MARVRVTETNFTGGEVSPLLLGRGDLQAFDNGAARLRNVMIHPTGGLSRRPGMAYVDDVPGDGRLVPFELSTDLTFILVLTDQRATVYRGDVLEAAFDTPWTLAHIAGLRWTQNAQSLILVHRDVPPQEISRRSEGHWQIGQMRFVEQEGLYTSPHHQFASDIELRGNGANGTISLFASADLFQDAHIGVRFRLNEGEAEVTDIVSPTQATAVVTKALSGPGAFTADWTEEAFSQVHGWPRTVTYHQGRMVFGGSRDLPNRIWMSKSGAERNFDLGAGLDDEAIDFALLSDQVNAVSAVFSGRHLQIFTSGSEWMVTGDPLTPSNVQVFRQTRVGSDPDQSVPPVSVDGATLFAARNGTQLHEFLYTDLEQAYLTADLTVLADHMLRQPVDQCFDPVRRMILMVNSDGGLVSLTLYRTERITARAGQRTDGDIRSIVAAGSEIWLMVRRGGLYALERLDDAYGVDAGRRQVSDTPRTAWDGFDHLEGRQVAVLADGALLPEKITVEGGSVRLDQPAQELIAGLPFTHEIEPLPPVIARQGIESRASAFRLIEARFRLHETKAMRVDVGRGFSDMSLRRLQEDTVFDADASPFTGDYRLKSLGWRRDGSGAVWRIEQDYPVPFTLLSVTTELGVNQ